MRAGVTLIGPGGRGGVQTYMRLVAERLARDRPERPVTRLDSRGPWGALSPVWTVAAAVRLAAATATGRTGAVHVMVSERASLARKAALALWARALGLRVIVHHHGADIVEAEGAPGPLGRLALRALGRAADRTLVLGRAWAEVAAAHGADPTRVEVLANALPDAPLPARADGAVLRVLFLAVMTERKGARVLLRALALLRARGVAFEALLVGDGPDRPAAEALAAALGLDAGAGVFFPGPAGPEEVARLMAWADVLAHPSSREGLPMTLLEAMRAGLPCVAAPAGAIGEALPEGDGLLHVPSEDPERLAAALERLARDPEGRRALGAAGRAAFLARFRLGAHAARLATLYGWDEAPAPAREGRRDPAFP